MSEYALPDLISHLKIDTSGLKKAQTEADSFLGKLGPGLLIGAAALVGLGAGITAFGLSAVDKMTASGQAAFEMSEKFGLLPGQASAWLAVAAQLGISGDVVGAGFKFLAKNVEGINLQFETTGKVSKASQQVFKDLGISIFDAGGKMKSANELMLEAADVFAKMPDGIEKTGLAMKLFGRSGADMIPILNQGRAGLEGLMASGQAAGTVMSTEQVEAAHKLFLEHKQLDTAIAGLQNRIGLALMPVMTALMNYILNTAVPALQRFSTYFSQHLWPAIQQVWAGFMQLLGPALQYIRDHFENLKPVLIALAIVAGIILGAIVVAIGLVVLAVVGLVVGITWLVGQFKEKFPQLLNHVQDFVIGVIQKFQSIVAFIKDLPGNITSAAKGLWDGIWNEFKVIYDRVANGLNRLIGAFNALPHLGAPNLPTLPILHGGGIVPGVPGSEVLALLQAGERVTAAGASTGNTYNLTLNGAGAANDPDGVRRTLQRMQFLGVPG